jgi:lipopolysaccharide export system permease protein
MITLMDRQMIRGYFKAYIVCFTSLLSLYVVVDLFTNLDDFTHHHRGLLAVLGEIAAYYGYRLTQIFDRLSEVIALLAGMFTVAWMQRCNEQTPYLSAGVPTRRLVAPVMCCAALMLGLGVVNQELVIPHFGPQLSYDKDDPEGEKETSVQGLCYDSADVHLTGERANRKRQTVTQFEAVLSENVAGRQIVIHAQEARYVAPGKGKEPLQGGWELTGATPADVRPLPAGGPLEFIDAGYTGRYFLHVKKVDFDALTRSPNWFQLTSTWRLFEELNKPDAPRQASMAVLFHMRLTRPLLGLLLVVMGLAVILRDQNRNIILSTGMCLVLCGALFSGIYTCRLLGEFDLVAPALAAWGPVLCFGPHAFVLLDAMHT